MPGKPLGAEGFKRLAVQALVLLGVIVMIGGLASFVFYLSLPYAGFEFVGAASIGTVMPDSPADVAGLQVGDRVLTMNGMVFRPGTPYLRPNQQDLQLTVSRDGQVIPLEIALVSPSPAERFYTTGYYLIALAFWIIAMAILVLKPGDLASWLFALASLLGAAGIVVWPIADLGVAWANLLMSAIVLSIGPLFVHLHTIFPACSDFRGRKALLPGLYVTGSILFLLSMVSDLVFYLQVDWGGKKLPSLAPLSEAFFSLCMIAGLVLLIRTYRMSESETNRRQSALILLGTVMAVLPFVLFIAIPQILSIRYPIPTWLTLLALVFIPLSYAYAIHRHDLMKLDGAIKRSVVFYLLALLFAVLYLSLSLSAHYLIPDLFFGSITPADVGLVVTLVLLFEPLKAWLKKLMDHVLYGGWYDYETLVSHMSGVLADALDTQSVVDSLANDMAGAMRLKAIALLLLVKGTLYVRANEGFTEPPPSRQGSPLATLLLKVRNPVSHAELCNRLQSDPGAREELDAWSKAGAQMWVPLVQQARLEGLLVLGGKAADAFFHQQDYRILATVAQQAAVAIVRVQLMDQLRDQLHEALALARAILALQEENRQQLALDLHDQVVQDLVAVRFWLEETRTTFLPERVAAACEKVLEMIGYLRTVIFELRPPAWDHADLQTALEDYTLIFAENRDLSIAFELREDSPDTEVSERVWTALFRILQESLRNAHRHARAEQIWVILNLQPDRVCMEVGDDGVGFEAAAYFGPFIERHQLGLVGMRQRARDAGGTFEVESTPGQGTRVLVEIPLPA